MTPVVVFVRYRALPERVEEALSAIGTLISTVQALESDCIGIAMYQETSDPSHITLIEHWTSQQAFTGPHMQQPYVQSFIQSAAALLSGPPEITFWRTVGDAQQCVQVATRETRAP